MSANKNKNSSTAAAEKGSSTGGKGKNLSPGKGSSTAGSPGKGSSTAGSPGKGSSTAGSPGKGSSTAGSPGKGSSPGGKGKNLSPGKGSFKGGKEKSQSPGKSSDRESSQNPGKGSSQSGQEGTQSPGKGSSQSGQESTQSPGKGSSRSGRRSTRSPGKGSSQSGLGSSSSAEEEKEETYVSVQSWPDGSRYEGEFLNGLKHGTGKFFWSNEEYYEGSFYKDYRHGTGVYYWPDGLKFTGRFYLDRTEGYGQQTLPDGFTFQGLYHFQQRCGPGVLTCPRGQQEVGLWYNELILKLCTSVDSFSLKHFPEYTTYAEPYDSSNLIHQVTQEAPSYDDVFIYSSNMEIYNTNGDHLPLPPGRRRELDKRFYGKLWEPEAHPYQGYERDPLLKLPLQTRMEAVIRKHRVLAQSVDWDLATVLALKRDGFGFKGPQEVASEHLILHSSQGDVNAVSQILQTGLVHPDVADSHGNTALIAATVNCQDSVIDLLLDKGANIDQLNEDGMSALAICFVLCHRFQSLRTSLGQPPVKTQVCSSLWEKEKEPSMHSESEAEMTDNEDENQTGEASTVNICTPLSEIEEDKENVLPVGNFENSKDDEGAANENNREGEEERLEGEPSVTEENDKKTEPTVGEKDQVQIEGREEGLEVPGTGLKASPSKLETSPSKLEASPSKPEASPSKLEASPSKPEASPSKLETSPSKLEASPSKLEASPSKLETSPSKLEASPSKLETSPSKLEASPSKLEASPSKLEASPSKQEASPSKLETSPSKLEASPSKPEASPSKLEAFPSKLEASPSKLEASPSKQEASPSKQEASPSKLEASPSKLEASPSKLEASPSKLEVSPSTLEVSSSALEVSSSALEVSSSALEVSPSRLDVSSSALEVSPTRMESCFSRMDFSVCSTDWTDYQDDDLLQRPDSPPSCASVIDEVKEAVPPCCSAIGPTVFPLAIENRVRVRTLKLLLERGADPNMAAIPLPILFLAILAAEPETVKTLLLCGARTDVPLSKQKKGLYPLHVAAALPEMAGVRITEMLLHTAVDPDAQACDQNERYERDAFFLANERPMTSSEALSTQNGGRTPLHIACMREDDFLNASKVVSALLSHQADTDLLWSGHSALSLAIATGNDLAVEELLKGGADPNLPLGPRVESALCALMNIKYNGACNKMHMLDLLMKGGADILMFVKVGDLLGTAVDYAYIQCKSLVHSNLTKREKKNQCQLFGVMGDLLVKAAQEREQHCELLGISKPDFKYCYNCGCSSTVKLTLCNACKNVYFCSVKCRTKAQKKHYEECRQVSKNQRPPMQKLLNGKKRRKDGMLKKGMFRSKNQRCKNAFKNRKGKKSPEVLIDLKSNYSNI